MAEPHPFDPEPEADRVTDLMAQLEASVARAKEARRTHPTPRPEPVDATLELAAAVRGVVAELEGEYDPDGAEVLAFLDEWGSGVLDLETLDDRARAWEALRQMAAAVSMLQEALAPVLHGSIPFPPGWADTPVGVLKRTKKGGSTSWDHDGLVRFVTTRAWERREPDPETGEMPDRGEVAVAAIKEAAGFSYWRVGVLRDAYGMEEELEEYRATTGKRPWITST